MRPWFSRLIAGLLVPALLTEPVMPFSSSLMAPVLVKPGVHFALQALAPSELSGLHSVAVGDTPFLSRLLGIAFPSAVSDKSAPPSPVLTHPALTTALIGVVGAAWMCAVAFGGHPVATDSPLTLLAMLPVFGGTIRLTPFWAPADDGKAGTFGPTPPSREQAQKRAERSWAEFNGLIRNSVQLFIAYARNHGAAQKLEFEQTVARAIAAAGSITQTLDAFGDGILFQHPGMSRYVRRAAGLKRFTSEHRLDFREVVDSVLPIVVPEGRSPAGFDRDILRQQLANQPDLLSLQQVAVDSMYVVELAWAPGKPSEDVIGRLAQRYSEHLKQLRMAGGYTVLAGNSWGIVVAADASRSMTTLNYAHALAEFLLTWFYRSWLQPNPDEPEIISDWVSTGISFLVWAEQKQYATVQDFLAHEDPRDANTFRSQMAVFNAMISLPESLSQQELAIALDQRVTAAYRTMEYETRKLAANVTRPDEGVEHVLPHMKPYLLGAGLAGLAFREALHIATRRKDSHEQMYRRVGLFWTELIQEGPKKPLPTLLSLSLRAMDPYGVQTEYGQAPRLPKLSIPMTAFNTLTLQHAGRSVEAALDELNTLIASHSDFENGHNHVGLLPLNDFSGFLRRLGAAAALQGPVIYAPLGGFDPYTLFKTVPAATDAVAVGREDFGSPLDIVKALASFQRLDVEARVYHYLYDLSKQMVTLRYTYGVSGNGILAIARIFSLLKARITGLYYFSIAEDGSIRFLQEDELGSTPSSAVIQFTDPADGIEKRYWYIQQDLRYPEPGFTRFIQTLRFQTFMIKAALNMWESTKPDRESVDAVTLAPAKANNAGVLADPNIYDLPHPIWVEGYEPRKIVLQIGEQFGYAGFSNYVVAGSGSKLLGPALTPIIEGGNLTDESETHPLRYRLGNALAQELGRVYTAGLMDAWLELRTLSARSVENVFRSQGYEPDVVLSGAIAAVIRKMTDQMKRTPKSILQAA